MSDINSVNDINTPDFREHDVFEENDESCALKVAVEMIKERLQLKKCEAIAAWEHLQIVQGEYVRLCAERDATKRKYFDALYGPNWRQRNFLPSPDFPCLRNQYQGSLQPSKY